MFVFHARRAALAVAAIIVSGCSTNSVIGATSAQHDALQSVVRADTAVHATYFPGDKVFVSNFYRSEIDVYPAHRQNAAPVAVIHDGVSAPYNLAIDASGRLFVPNNNDTISIYLPGQTTPSKTLIEPVAGPGGLGVGVNVAVGAGDTVISVDHYASQVYEYLDGATNPTYEYEVDQAFGLAVDSRNDFYVGYSPGNSNYGGVLEFIGGKMMGKDLGIKVQLGGGLALDAAGDLLVGDQGNYRIDIYKPGESKPFRIINTYPNYPYQFALDAANEHLYLVGGSPAAVYVYNYKSGHLVWNDSQGLPAYGYALGVALQPASALP